MPISSKPIVFLAFSNSDNRPLSSLTEERRAIERYLTPLAEQGKCELIVKGDATLEDIFEVFNHRNNRNRIAVFHYAGHAGGNGLEMIHTDGSNQITHTSGLAKFFGMQKNLHLVFLNGCETEAQVELLQSQDIPNIIATSAEIEDDVAKMLAEKFYQTFAQNKSIKESFVAAVGAVEAAKGPPKEARYYRKTTTSHGYKKEIIEELPWKAYFNKGDWHLAHFRPINNPFKVFLAYSFYDEEEKSKLDRQLAVLKRRGLIDVFSETGVEAGKATNETIMEHLNTAHIVLLFVSENLFFDAAELIDEVVKRYERDAIILIPVYMKKCVIEDEKFAQLKPLPSKHLHNGQIWRFVNEWNKEDMAYYEIAKGLRDLITSLKQQNA
ncbi:MAG: CHAT domain-containing protein [Chitinophagales bacterium]